MEPSIPEIMEDAISPQELIDSYDEESVEMLQRCQKLNPAFSNIHISTSTMYYKISCSIPFSDPVRLNTAKFLEVYPETVKEFTIKSNFGNALNFKFSLVSGKSYCVLIFKSGFQIKGSKSAVTDYTIMKAILIGYGLEDATITELYPTMINANFDTYKILCLDTMANYLTLKKQTFVLNPTRLRVTLVCQVEEDVTKKITGIIYGSGKINLMGANRFEQIVAFYAFISKMLLEQQDIVKGDFVPEPPRPKAKPGRKRNIFKEERNDKLKQLLVE